MEAIRNRGRYWLYVRAYELLRKIPKINGDFPRLHAFNRQVEWVEDRLDKIKDLRNEMNCNPAKESEFQWLDDLRVGKPKPKGNFSTNCIPN